jgi:hypothetical protein
VKDEKWSSPYPSGTGKRKPCEIALHTCSIAKIMDRVRSADGNEQKSDSSLIVAENDYRWREITTVV